ncbi:Similar to Ack-like: Activated Cdc42 kinase-like (Drosophila melanogaster), partial [Cotesia congregata]
NHKEDFIATLVQGDVITVLTKGVNNVLWKGVLSNGKTGLFSPAHTIAYLGSNLPSNKPGEFLRGDGKNAFSSHRRKIRTDMISSPQGDLRHTGHVGLDGAYFGDISFLGGKYPHLPRQIVTPYKPQEDAAINSSQIFYQDSNNHDNSNHAASGLTHVDMSHKNEDQSIISTNIDNAGNNDHEYHEISDEENQDNALRFDKPLDFDFGPRTSSPSSPQGHPTSAEHESSNVKNELREMQSKQGSKKKQATVKPISAADQKTLYSAIAMAQELTARSMTDLEYPPESPVTTSSPSRRRKFSFKLPHQHSPKPDRRHFAEEAASIPDIQWLCSSLQSLSSTVSSLESLGAPSTLKLPLWDKASAEFCFAKSRELLTKSNAWTTYMDMAFDNHMLNNKAMKQNLVKSTEFLEASNSNSKGSINYSNIALGNSRNSTQGMNGKASRLSSPNLNVGKEARRISTSYIDRYFEQSQNYDTDNALECPTETFDCYKENMSDRDLKTTSSLTDSNDQFANNFYKYTLIDEPKYTLTDDPKYLHQIINKSKLDDIRNLRRNSYIAETLNQNSSNSGLLNKYQVEERIKNSVPNKRTDFDIFDKFSKKNVNGDGIKNIKEVKASAGAAALPTTLQDQNIACGMQTNRITNLKSATSIADNSNDYVNAIRAGQNYPKNDFKKKSDLLPYSILHNPLFISEPIKKDIDISSSGSESLRLNFERLRLQSDIETKNQIQLNSKISMGDNFGVFTSKNVKHYPDDKKRTEDPSKFSQNIASTQFDNKNIARNSRNLELLPGIKSDLNTGIDLPANEQFILASENIPMRDPPNRVNNIAQAKLTNEGNATGLELHLNAAVRNKMGINSKTHQRLLEFPRRCRNEIINKNNKLIKQTGSIDNNKVDIDKNLCRPRTFSLSDAVKNTTRKSIRSFYSSSQCSDDSDSIFYSDTDIRSRLKFQRRRKKVSGNSKVGYNKKNRESLGVYPNDVASSYSIIQNSEKSPLPSTSFLNSLSSQFSLCNQTVSWPESAPSSSQTFTKEAKEVYNSLVEAQALDSTTDTNPLRMLRSGLPVRPRVRGNKQLSLGLTTPQIDETVGLSDNSKLSTDFYQVGSSTFPKTGELVNNSLPIFSTQSLERHNSLMNIENSQNQNNFEENPIPLPPRDRSRTLQSKSNLPRHQRKHPLIIPGGGISRTLAKAIATSSVEDQIDGVVPSINLSNPNVSFSTQMIPTTSLSNNPAPNSPDEFERRIDSELAALDSLSLENNCSHPCGMISEDLLENSDLSDDSSKHNHKKIDSDAVKNSNYLINSENSQSKNVTKLSFDVVTETHSDNKNITDDVNSPRSTSLNSNGDESDALAPVKSNAQALTEFSYLQNKTSSPLNPFDANVTANESDSDEDQKFKSPKTTTGNVSKIQETDDRSARGSDLYRQSDHVSCEDLLEFACDRPNVRRTRGPHNGAHSDEVRIMLKVLQDQSTPESCVTALNVANWDILAAIKLERLQALLKKENKFIGLEECKVMLNQCDGDIVKAAASIKNSDDSTPV